MKTQKKLAAGILPIAKNTGRILLGRRSLFDASFPNHWSLFGGTFEDSDGTPKETAKREFKEETKCTYDYSISKKPIDVRMNNHINYYTYIGIFDNEFVPYVNGLDEHSKEHQDYGWFELEQMPETLVDGLKETFLFKKNEIQDIINKIKIVWINVNDKMPDTESYYKVKFDDGTEDEKYFRNRPQKNIYGFMSEKNVIEWRKI